MKRLFKYLFLLSVISLGASCSKDFLNVTPKGKLIAQATIDYDRLFNNNTLSSSGATAQVPMSDEMIAWEPDFSSSDLTMQRQFRWDSIIQQPDANSDEIDGIMPQLYTYNKIINEVPSSTGGTTQQKAALSAEAMAGRAWCYFTLINFYGKPYVESSAATDPGYPIVTTADVTATKFARASVKDVYDFIIGDLTSAIPNLNLTTATRIRMSKGAAEALLGKVYMFMDRFTDALPLLNAAVTDMSSAGTPMTLYDYNVEFGPTGLFQPIGYFGPTIPNVFDNQECMYNKSFLNSYAFYAEDLLISPQTVALYDPSDLRLNFFTSTSFDGLPYVAGTMRRTGPLSGDLGVMVPDLLLLRAECKARLNDLAGAQADVQTLRYARMPAANAPVPNAIASQQIPLLKFIMDERMREYAARGLRWFDMRRLSVDPVIPQTSFSHLLYNADGTFTTITVKPERLTLRIPQLVISQNPGMQNNP